MNKKYGWFNYTFIFIPLLGMAFYFPNMILKQYGPKNIKHFWDLSNSYGIYEILNILFLFAVDAILIILYAILLMTVAQEVKQKNIGLWLGFIGLSLAFVLFFSTQDVGVNIYTIIFFICFNIYSYVSFFKLLEIRTTTKDSHDL